jgi:hypothetical protein
MDVKRTSATGNESFEGEIEACLAQGISAQNKVQGVVHVQSQGIACDGLSLRNVYQSSCIEWLHICAELLTSLPRGPSNLTKNCQLKLKLFVLQSKLEVGISPCFVSDARLAIAL